MDGLGPSAVSPNAALPLSLDLSDIRTSEKYWKHAHRRDVHPPPPNPSRSLIMTQADSGRIAPPLADC